MNITQGFTLYDSAFIEAHETPLQVQALIYARTAHASIKQRRKYLDLPYIVHPIDVHNTLLYAGERNEQILAAAYLHDVVEDVPGYTIEKIAAEFGPEVALHVDGLTDKFTKEAHPRLNRTERKEKERNRFHQVSFGALKVKLADLIDNTKTITVYDKDFAVVYLKEKRALLEIIRKRMDIETDAVAEILYKHAVKQIAN